MQENDSPVLYKKDLITVRDYVPADRNFILASWLRGLYYGSTWFSEIPKGIFMANYHNVLERILSHTATVIKIACLRDEPETILGYSVYREGAGICALDYVFVKSRWRRIGIARDLVPVNMQYCTHLTKLGKVLKPQGCVYNPFLT